MAKVLTLKQLPSTIKKLKQGGKKIISTNGVFDILHPGHVSYLSKARKLGDALIVAVNSDSSARKFKGDNRPIHKAGDRAKVLAGLESVDYVVIFNEQDPGKILGVIKPDVHVKGGDYKPHQLPERKVVEKFGGKIKIIPTEKKGTYSTSNTIHSILIKHRK